MQVTPASDPNTGHRGTASVESHSYFYEESAEREDLVEDFGKKKCRHKTMLHKDISIPHPNQPNR